MIINLLLQSYLYLYVAVLFHEFSHVIVAWFIHLPILEFCIGEELFSIKSRRLSLSPLLFFGSHISFSIENLSRKKNKEIFFFFLAGPIANLLLAVCGAILHFYGNKAGLSILFINALLFITNMLPYVLPQNDFNQFLVYSRNCRKDRLE